jgi:PAS domain S-box-containing protein
MAKRPNLIRRSGAAGYAVALGAVVIGWLAREVLSAAIGPTALPFIFFFPAVVVASWYGGIGPGVVSIVLSVIAADWFFIEPTHSLIVGSTFGAVALLSFCIASSLIAGAIEAMHHARIRLAQEISERGKAEGELTSARDLLAITLASIGDGVIVTDAKGHITFLNPEAERLTHWSDAEAKGHLLAEVFRIVNEKTRKPAENPVEKVFRTGKVADLANHTVLLARNGAEIPIDDSAAPIRQPAGPLFGVVLVFRDVTNQRRAHEASTRLAAIVEHSGDTIFTKNLDGIIQTWNASAERLFGYGAEEIVGQPVTRLFPPDRLSEEDHILESLRAGKPVERLETIRIAKNGRPIPVSVNISPLRNAEGELVGASKVIHDITDLVAAREALVQEKELLATTLASIGDGVIVTDATGHVTFLNSEAERLTKWSCAEAAGHALPKIFQIVNEETRAPVEDPVEKVIRLNGVVGLANHTVLIGKDGTEIPIDDSAAPIRRPGGTLSGVVLVFRDFTQRKEAERRLHELSLLPAQNPAPILRISGYGTLLYGNPAAIAALKDWNLTMGQQAPEQVFALASYALKKRQIVEREVTLTNRSYFISVVPLTDLGYANLYWTDVTERRQAEQDLRLAHEQLAGHAEQLESLVLQRTARLNEIIGDLEAFSYSIVHDMRGPLRAMQSFARLLVDECGTLSSAGENYVQRIERAADRMDRLIQDGLNYSRVMRSELPLGPVDPGELLQGIVESYPALQAPHSNIELAERFPLVRANEAGLTQCLSNLLDNAVKFVPKGVIPRVRVWAEKRGDRIRLLVKDNGIGISESAHQKIFQIFQRLDNAYEGTGIGLAIVKKAAERMDGKVGVESKPGQGSTFWLELNSTEESARPTEA